MAEHQLFSAFERVIRHWVELRAPDDAEGDATALHDQRRVDASRSLGGAIYVDALLDPITGQIWLRELERLEQIEFESDLDRGPGAAGRGGHDLRPRRSPKQRRADGCG